MEGSWGLEFENEKDHCLWINKTEEVYQVYFNLDISIRYLFIA